MSFFTILDFFSRLDLSKLTCLALDATLPDLRVVSEEWLKSRFPISLPRVEYFRGPLDYLSKPIFDFSLSLNEAWIIPRTGDPWSHGLQPFWRMSMANDMTPLFKTRQQHLLCDVIGLIIDQLPMEFSGYTFNPADANQESSARLHPHEAVIQEMERDSQRVGFICGGVTDLALCSFETYEQRLSMLVSGPGRTRKIDKNRALCLVTWLCGFVNLRRVEFKGGELGGWLVAAASDFASLLKERQPILQRLKIGDQLYSWDS